MVVSKEFTINGFRLIFIALGFDDGIKIPNDVDITSDGFIETLKVAQAVHPDFYDFALCTDHYKIYYPTDRDLPDFVSPKFRAEFVQILHVGSIETANRHKNFRAYQSKQKQKSYEGYIYLLRAITPDNHYKIGMSTDPVKRVESLDVKLPFPIEAIHTFPTNNRFAAEKALHTKYDNQRVNGEWFKLSDDDVAEICKLQKLQIED